MKIHLRYVFKKIIIYSLISLFFLVLIFSLFHFLEEMNKDYEIGSKIEYLLYSLPSIAHLLSIFAILIGAILTLGTLNSNRELQILLTGGIGLRQILINFMLISFFLSVFFIAIGEIFSPTFYEKSNQIKNTALGRPYMNANKNLWFKEENKIFNIGESYDGKQFKNINIFVFEKNNLQEIINSNHGSLLNNKLILDETKIQKINTESESQLSSLSNLTLEKFDTGFTLSKQNITALNKDVRSMTFIELIEGVFFRVRIGLNSEIYLQEIISRLIKPITLMGMILLAAPLLLNLDRALSIGNMIFLGLGFGLLFQIFSRMINALSIELQLSVVWSLIVPNLTLIFLGFIFSRGLLRS